MIQTAVRVISHQVAQQPKKECKNRELKAKLTSVRALTDTEDALVIAKSSKLNQDPSAARVQSTRGRMLSCVFQAKTEVTSALQVETSHMPALALENLSRQAILREQTRSTKNGTMAYSSQTYLDFSVQLAGLARHTVKCATNVLKNAFELPAWWFRSDGASDIFQKMYCKCFSFFDNRHLCSSKMFLESYALKFRIWIKISNPHDLFLQRGCTGRLIFEVESACR